MASGPFVVALDSTTLPTPPRAVWMYGVEACGCGSTTLYGEVDIVMCVADDLCEQRRCWFRAIYIPRRTTGEILTDRDMFCPGDQGWETRPALCMYLDQNEVHESTWDCISITRSEPLLPQATGQPHYTFQLTAKRGQKSQVTLHRPNTGWI